MKEENYSIQAFSTDDVEQYKAMRLEALKNEPGMFGNSHAFESSFTEDQWFERVNNPNAVCFGLFHYEELIGITSIIINNELPAEAYMTQSYIRNSERGKGLSKLLYHARIDWAKSKGLTRLKIGHRESNLISKKAIQGFGFVYTHQEIRNWPDGGIEPMLYYELILEIS